MPRDNDLTKEQRAIIRQKPPKGEPKWQLAWLDRDGNENPRGMPYASERYAKMDADQLNARLPRNSLGRYVVIEL